MCTDRTGKSSFSDSNQSTNQSTIMRPHKLLVEVIPYFIHLCIQIKFVRLGTAPYQSCLCRIIKPCLSYMINFEGCEIVLMMKMGCNKYYILHLLQPNFKTFTRESVSRTFKVKLCISEVNIINKEVEKAIKRQHIVVKYSNIQTNNCYFWNFREFLNFDTLYLRFFSCLQNSLSKMINFKS